MKEKTKLLIKSLALPLLGGTLAGLLSQNAMNDFKLLEKPPLAPPGWLFPVVWTVLYLLMGYSAYLIRTSKATNDAKTNTLSLYYYQLIVNFLWPIFFFNFGWYFFALLWLLLLWMMVLGMIRAFAKISRPAAYLNVPYLIWLTFAAYLNAAIWLLNL